MIKYIRRYSRDIYWAGSAIVISAALQLVNATRFSFWHDESFSVVLAMRDIPGVIATTAADVHPPLYYILLHGWMSVFGQNDMAIRGLSILFLLGALVVLYRILKRFVHPVAARWGIVVAALGPFLLRYGIEARMYTLATLLLVGSTWFLLRYLEDRRVIHAVLYGMCIAAALYTHYFTFPVVLVHGVYLFRYQAGSVKPTWKRVTHVIRRQQWWLYSICGAAVAFLPWAPIAFAQTESVSGGFWVPPETLLDPFHTVIFYQSNIGAGVLAWWHQMLFGLAFAAIAACVFLAWRANPENRDKLRLLAMAAILPLFVILAASYALSESSVYVDRYFVYFAPFWYGLLGVSIWLLKGKPWLRYGLIGIIVIQFGIGIYTFYALGNYSWDRYLAHDMKETMSVLNERHRTGEEILVANSGLYMYFDAVHYNETSATVRTTDPGYDRGNASIITGREAQLVKEISAYDTGDRVWLLTPRGNMPPIPDDWHSRSRVFKFNQAVMQKFRVMGG